MKGILFKPDMIQAIIEGRKTQTRRIDKLANKIALTYERTWVHFNKHYGWWELKGRSEYSGYIEPFVIKPRYQIGETVYIKEAWQILDVDPKENDYYPTQIEYKDGAKVWLNRPGVILKVLPNVWFSPMMMPEWAARYFVLMLEVKPQRVQEITEEDCCLEGINKNATCYIRETGKYTEERTSIPRVAFSWLWDSINPKYPFEMNPWEFTYTFRLEAR